MSGIDYKCWLARDNWTMKDAALILTGADPDEHRSVRFTQGVKPELEQAKRIYNTIAGSDIFRYHVGTDGRQKKAPPICHIYAAAGAIEFNNIIEKKFECELRYDYKNYLKEDLESKKILELNRKKLLRIAEERFSDSIHKIPPENENTFKLLGVLSMMLIEERGAQSEPMSGFIEDILEFMRMKKIDVCGLKESTIEGRLKYAKRIVKLWQKDY